jgi:hypothetical protein
MAKIEAALPVKSDDDDDDDDDYEGVSSHMDVECDGLYTGGCDQVLKGYAIHS